jgi:hypothetical protein
MEASSAPSYAHDGQTSAAVPLTGRQVWTGEDLRRDTSWIKHWWPEALEEVHEAFSALPSPLEAPVESLSAADFPLPGLRGFFDEIARELEDGRGAVRLRGFPIERYTEEECRIIFWCISRHLGTPAASPPRSGFIGVVKDLSDAGGLVAKQLAAAMAAAGGDEEEEGAVLASFARANSTGPLRWHTDPFDLILLFCTCAGADGGLSKLSSQSYVYNQILERRPDLHALLCQDYWRLRPSDADSVGEGDDEVWALPPLAVRGNKTANTQYSRTYIEQAQERAEEFGVPLLTPAHDEALDMLAEVAEEGGVTLPFEAGDLQLVNNHNCFHGTLTFTSQPSTRHHCHQIEDCIISEDCMNDVIHVTEPTYLTNQSA